MARLQAKRNKGQGLIEAVACLLTMGVFLSGLLLFSYIGVAYGFTDQLFYEGLICLAEGKEEGFCEKKLKTRLKNAFSNLKIEKVDFKRKENRYEGKVYWILKRKRFFYKKKKNLYKKDLLKIPKDLRLFF